jgi:hypothetical protein
MVFHAAACTQQDFMAGDQKILFNGFYWAELGPLEFTAPPNSTGIMMVGENSRGDLCREFWRYGRSPNSFDYVRIWGHACYDRLNENRIYFPEELN